MATPILPRVGTSARILYNFKAAVKIGLLHPVKDVALHEKKGSAYRVYLHQLRGVPVPLNWVHIAILSHLPAANVGLRRVAPDGGYPGHNIQRVGEKLLEVSGLARHVIVHQEEVIRRRAPIFR